MVAGVDVVAKRKLLEKKHSIEYVRKYFQSQRCEVLQSGYVNAHKPTTPTRLRRFTYRVDGFVALRGGDTDTSRNI